MALPNPADGDTIQATDVSDIKNHLEGGSAKTAPYHLKQSTGNFQITLSTNDGSTKFRLNDSDAAEIFSVDSNGVVAFATSPTFSTLVLPQAASPTPTVEGQIYWDTDDNTIKVGDSAATKEFGYLGTSTPAASGTAAAGTSKETSRADHVHAGVTAKYKTATQVITTTTAYADVAASSGSFAFAIAANEVWLAEFYIPLSFGGTGGAKFQITGPAAPTSVDITGLYTSQRQTSATDGIYVGFATPFTAVAAFSTDIAAVNSLASTNATGYYTSQSNFIHIRARIINGANAGTVTLQAAQNSSNSTTTLGIGSYMRAEKIA